MRIILDIPENKYLFFLELIKSLNFAKVEESPYNPEFVAKIERSRQQAKEGKTVSIELDNIWKE